MSLPLAGVRVLEVASHVYVPIAGAILTEWGAEVIKVEHPETGDPYRGLVTMGLHKSYDGVDPSFQFTNRGKRSVAIDLKKPEGQKLVYQLAETCDVFLTNFRPDALRRLKIECDDIRARNKDIIYVRGSGYGPRGPDAQRGGYDAAAFWSRTGIGEMITPVGAEYPVMQRPAFGDIAGGMTIAGAIAAAMYRRAATGEPSLVDVSLMGVGLWQLQPDITHSQYHRNEPRLAYDRKASWNPLSGTYKTRDGRFITLVMIDADRYWADFCQVIGRPELTEDPRFVDMPMRRENSRACIAILDAVFAERDYAEWCTLLSAAKGVWSPFQRPEEILADTQVLANGHLAQVEMINGSQMTMVTAPAQFDQANAKPTRAPEHGEHTEEVLLDLGVSWETLADLKDRAVIG
jgi:crotonobetainyl-CoA:carnitine CoA-transferase CaiB-like acyl-CoA transferase